MKKSDRKKVVENDMVTWDIGVTVEKERWIKTLWK